MRRAFLLLPLFAALSAAQIQTYDLVIQGGRVMDPASGRDEVLNVGVLGRKIAVMTPNKIEGRATLNAAGHVVAPGFIDLHQHGQSPVNYRAQIHDGVTTALELEIGVEDIPSWYAEREGKSPVNFGASISHPYSRNIVQTGSNPGLEGEAMARPLTADETWKLQRRIAEALGQGAAAVGFGIAYTPGVTQEELNAIFEKAANYNAVCHVHMRGGQDLENLNELLTAAEATGAALHVVHLNSSAKDDAPKYLAAIQAARDRGLDVTTEVYPYNQGSTMIQAHLFNDWESYTDEYISEFIWVETGERLNRKTFAEKRKIGGTIISPPTYSLDTVKTLVAHPLTMIASDGMWIDGGRAHPRTYGTFSRILGRYVREEKALSLMTALEKMTIRPAQRMQARVPRMRRKGRLEPGMDADIVVFNPDTVIDKATYEDPAQYSTGFAHVLVNGVVTLQDGKLVEGAAGGVAIRAH